MSSSDGSASTGHEVEDHDRGLAFDLHTLQRQRLGRRSALAMFGGAGLLALVGCATSDPSSTATPAATPATDRASTGTTEDVAECGTTIPEETAGPFPGDGSNGPDVLTEDGIVRSDIRSSFGSSTTTAEGVPLTITLAVVDTSNGCTAMAGAAVYAWHCDRDGGYSMYSQGLTEENYLRGVQETDASGTVTYQSIFPACYSGRWPHVHFEVYASVADATSGGRPIATSQLALPEAVCTTVYATTGYEQSVRNLAQVSLTQDNVFGDDGGVHQLATVTGSTTDGYTATLTVPV